MRFACFIVLLLILRITTTQADDCPEGVAVHVVPSVVSSQEPASVHKVLNACQFVESLGARHGFF